MRVDSDRLQVATWRERSNEVAVSVVRIRGGAPENTRGMESRNGAGETGRSVVPRVTEGEEEEEADGGGEQRGDGGGARGMLYNGRGTWCVPPLNRSHPGLIFSLSAFDPSKLRCRYN